MRITDCTWRGEAGASIERLRITEDGSVRAHSHVRVGDARYEYEVLLGSGWVFRAARVVA